MKYETLTYEELINFKTFGKKIYHIAIENIGDITFYRRFVIVYKERWFISLLKNNLKIK